MTPKKMGENCIISDGVIFGDNVVLNHNCIIESGVMIGDNTYIDSNTIIRNDVTIGKDSFIGSNCIIGEKVTKPCTDKIPDRNSLIIGDEALIRSGSIIYTNSKIGEGFQTGHRVTIREKTSIGNHVSVGTLSDIQGNCCIGNYVRLHSNVHIGQLSRIDDFVWIFPYVILTNDPTPPSDDFIGVHVSSFSIIAAGAIVMPGIEIGQDALVAAGAIVTKKVVPYAVVAGNPAKVISDVRNIKSKISGKPVYPWREHFKKYMPWEESDFISWYQSLSLKSKKEFGIDKII